MLVPPTTLAIEPAALSEIRGIANAEWYTDGWLKGNVVVHRDEIVHGHLFVAAAIFLSMPLISVTTWSEFNSGRPSAEIVCS